MKRKYFCTCKKKGDFYHFFLNGKDVTNEWMEFFSGLEMGQEKNCVRLFIRKYAKKLVGKNSPVVLK